MPDPMIPDKFCVEDLQKETHDTFTLRLSSGNGQGFSFSPGQFNMLYAFGVGEVPISISGDPENAKNLIHTIRSVGPVTQALEQLDQGDVLGVRGPFGNPWPMEEARGKDVVIVSGGIGLAALRPAIYHILNHRENYGRVFILYGARDPEDILYQTELQSWQSHLDLHVRVTVDKAKEEWHGSVGVVTTLISRADFYPRNTMAFVCGPEIMMHFSLRELQRMGVPDPNIYVSMERNMKCGIGLCGHCQYGPKFVCKDGPVFRLDDIRHLLVTREI